MYDNETFKIEYCIFFVQNLIFDFNQKKTKFMSIVKIEFSK